MSTATKEKESAVFFLARMAIVEKYKNQHKKSEAGRGYLACYGCGCRHIPHDYYYEGFKNPTEVAFHPECLPDDDDYLKKAEQDYETRK